VGSFGQAETEKDGYGSAEALITASNLSRGGILAVRQGRAKMPDEPPSASLDRELTSRIVAAYVRCSQIASDQLATLISTVHQALANLGTGSRSRQRANTGGFDPSIGSPRLCCLPRMWVARPDAQTAFSDRPWIEHRPISRSLELAA
jgi:ROS/MUCR transcriptional regulator protein